MTIIFVLFEAPNKGLCECPNGNYINSIEDILASSNIGKTIPIRRFYLLSGIFFT